MRKAIFSLIVICVLSLSGAVYAQSGEAPFTIGLLISHTDSSVFIDEMTSLGYIEGTDVNYRVMPLLLVESQVFEDQVPQLQEMIAEPVDIFVVDNDTGAMAIRAYAPDIPVVFTISDDPVANGTVADITTPGGNTTGLMTNRHHERRLQLLTEVIPTTKSVYYLYYAPASDSVTIFNQVTELGEELGVEVIGAPITDLESAMTLLQEAPEDIDWLFITPYVPFDNEDFTELLLATSESHHAPIAGFFAAVVPGYLVSYGPDLPAVTRHAAQIVDRIFRGADPGELPIGIVENGLVIDLTVADSMGIDVPIAVLRQADLIVHPGDADTTTETGG